MEFIKTFQNLLNEFLKYASKHRGDYRRNDGVRISTEISCVDWIDYVAMINTRLMQNAVRLNEYPVIRSLGHFHGMINDIKRLSTASISIDI